MIRSYRFSSDPGHGWLRVSVAELHELGIWDRITQFSYLTDCGTWAWLEEDCDLATFVKAKAAQLGVEPRDVFGAGHCAMVARSSNSLSPVRRLRRYSAALIGKEVRR